MQVTVAEKKENKDASVTMTKVICAPGAIHLQACKPGVFWLYL